MVGREMCPSVTTQTRPEHTRTHTHATNHPCIQPTEHIHTHTHSQTPSSSFLSFLPPFLPSLLPFCPPSLSSCLLPYQHNFLPASLCFIFQVVPFFFGSFFSLQALSSLSLCSVLCRISACVCANHPRNFFLFFSFVFSFLLIHWPFTSHSFIHSFIHSFNHSLYPKCVPRSLHKRNTPLHPFSLPATSCATNNKP